MDVYDYGLHQQLRDYPRLGLKDLALHLPDARPEDAPWPLILVAWLCQLRVADEETGEAVLRQIRHRIDSGEYQFLSARQFRKLTRLEDVGPGTRLMKWNALWLTAHSNKTPGGATGDVDDKCTVS